MDELADEDRRARHRRRELARIAAFAMHHKHPDAARKNGAKGGRVTANRFVEGPAAWARRMSLARWADVPFRYRTTAPPAIANRPDEWTIRDPKPGLLPD